MFFGTDFKLRFILFLDNPNVLQAGTCARPYGCGASLHGFNKRSELVVVLGAGCWGQSVHRWLRNTAWTWRSPFSCCSMLWSMSW